MLPIIIVALLVIWGIIAVARNWDDDVFILIALLMVITVGIWVTTRCFSVAEDAELIAFQSTNNQIYQQVYEHSKAMRLNVPQPDNAAFDAIHMQQAVMVNNRLKEWRNAVVAHNTLVQ